MPRTLTTPSLRDPYKARSLKCRLGIHSDWQNVTSSEGLYVECLYCGHSWWWVHRRYLKPQPNRFCDYHRWPQWLQRLRWKWVFWRLRRENRAP